MIMAMWLKHLSLGASVGLDTDSPASNHLFLTDPRKRAYVSGPYTRMTFLREDTTFPQLANDLVLRATPCTGGPKAPGAFLS